jgi:hypothetical protein
MVPNDIDIIFEIYFKLSKKKEIRNALERNLVGRSQFELQKAIM